MVYLIDPSSIKGKKCPKFNCEVVCTLCGNFCGRVIQPMYGIPPGEE